MMEQKQLYCPVCETERSTNYSLTSESYPVCGESITIEVPTWKCSVCGQSIVENSFGDPVEHAFSVYRKKHGLLFPAEIKQIREKWRLSQSAFAALLKMSPATINRYEGGSIQQPSADLMIRCCSKVEFMDGLVEGSGDLLTPQQRKDVKEAIEDEGAGPSRIYLSLRERMEWGSPDALNGFRKFDMTRYCAVVAWFCANVPHVTQTKLYKLLFYVDFLSFKSSRRSLTGASYRKMQYGPVPVNFSSLRTELEEREVVKVFEQAYQNGFTGEVFQEGPRARDLPVKFTDDEVKLLEFIRDNLGHLTPSAISNRSHKETAWKDTRDKEIISYAKANELSLSLPEECPSL